MDLLQKFVRKSKDLILRRSYTEVLTRDATNNDEWGPTTSAMRLIADLSFNYNDYREISLVLWERINDDSKNWRHIYKALILLDYLIRNGYEAFIDDARYKLVSIKTLSEFTFDENGRERGGQIRTRSKAICEILGDEKKLREERMRALANKEKFGRFISYNQADLDARSRFALGDKYTGHGLNDTDSSKYASSFHNPQSVSYMDRDSSRDYHTSPQATVTFKQNEKSEIIETNETSNHPFEKGSDVHDLFSMNGNTSVSGDHMPWNIRNDLFFQKDNGPNLFEYQQSNLNTANTSPSGSNNADKNQNSSYLGNDNFFGSVGSFDHQQQPVNQNQWIQNQQPTNQNQWVQDQQPTNQNQWIQDQQPTNQNQWIQDQQPTNQNQRIQDQQPPINENFNAQSSINQDPSYTINNNSDKKIKLDNFELSLMEFFNPNNPVIRNDGPSLADLRNSNSNNFL